MRTLVQALTAIAVLGSSCADDAGEAPNGPSSDMSGRLDFGHDAVSGDATGQADVVETSDIAIADLGDLSPAADGGVDMSRPLGDPIEAPNEEWSWVDFPGALCGNGQPTGIGVNLTDRSDDVFVFLMGGGACWDVNTCFVLNAAANIESGYDEARFENEGVLGASAFDRDDSDNPLRDLSWVFVPYCTGDVHAGDKVTTYMAAGQSRDVHHVGSANVREYLARLLPTFSAAERVFVGGSSAGGFGAQLNFHQFAGAFTDAEVHVLSDSGPLVQPSGSRLAAWDSAWTLQTPTGCDACGTSFPEWYDFLVDAYPESRFGLLSYLSDQTIHIYFGYPAGNSFTQALASYLDDHVEPAANGEVFGLAGTQHVLLGGLTTITAPNGARLSDWTEAWMEGDAAWTTVRP